MDFFIKQYSTSPKLVFPFKKTYLEMYDLTKEDFEDAALTFSMIDSKTKLYEIANVSGFISFRGDDKLYNNVDIWLEFEFCRQHTTRPGKYYGEFKIDFFTPQRTLTIPSDNSKIDITISPSTTKTDVIYV